MKIGKFAEKLGMSEDELLEIILMLDSEYSEDDEKLSKDLMASVKAYIKKSKDEQKEEIIVTEDASEKVEEIDQESIGLLSKMTVKGLAESLELPLVDVMTSLVKNGFMLNLNSIIDFDVAALIADELEKKVHKIEEDSIHKSQIEEIDLGTLIHEKDKSSLPVRAPVVSVTGHVDHGKTSLLDYIRKTNVAGKEAGAITQSIGAYKVVHKGKEITFLDTPGHEAFVAMRRRGVRATDVAILVVAADDGIKAQTLEAIYHVKEAGIPIVVAVSKIDREGANINRVKEQLADNNLLIEEWGGSVVFVPISSKTGEGIDTLLESVSLIAEMEDLKANPDRSAIGTVIESNLDQKLGAVATVVIHTGTLHPRDIVVIGEIHGRVRALLDQTMKSTNEAGPSTPVLITGLRDVPQVGDILRVVPNERLAKDMAENVGLKRETAKKHKDILDVELINRKVKEQSISGINIILRSDTEGSLEAIKNQLTKVKTEDAKIRVIRSRTGDVSASDVSLAQISNAFIVTFNSKANSEALAKAQDEGVDIMNYDVIYKLVEDLTERLLISIEKKYEKIDIGKAKVLKVFLTKKDFMIVGIKVSEGKVQKMTKAQVTRGGSVVGEVDIPKVQLLKREVHMVEADSECGIRVEKMQLQEGDELAIYELVEKKVELI